MWQTILEDVVSGQREMVVRGDFYDKKRRVFRRVHKTDIDGLLNI